MHEKWAAGGTKEARVRAGAAAHLSLDLADHDVDAGNVQGGLCALPVLQICVSRAVGKRGHSTQRRGCGARARADMGIARTKPTALIPLSSITEGRASSSIGMSNRVEI